MVNKKSILDKVNFLLLISKKGKCTENELVEIKELIPEHSNDMVLGKVFGYSVSDYAIATLKWIGMNSEFNSIYDSLSNIRKNEIEKLISRKVYLEY